MRDLVTQTGDFPYKTVGQYVINVASFAAFPPALVFSMLPDSRTDQLVRLTYEAAADPSRWNDFLRLFSEAIHAPSVVFRIHNKTQEKADASAALRVDPAWVKSYEE